MPSLAVQNQASETTEGAALGAGAPVKSKLPKSERAMNGPSWIAEYERAVSGVIGNEWGFTQKDLHQLEGVIEKFCADRSNIDGWIRTTVTAFASSIDAKEVRFYSQHRPAGLLKWLNEGGARNGTNGHTNGTGKTGYMMHQGKMIDRATRKVVDPVTKEPIA